MSKAKQEYEAARLAGLEKLPKEQLLELARRMQGVFEEGRSASQALLEMPAIPADVFDPSNPEHMRVARWALHEPALLANASVESPAILLAITSGYTMGPRGHGGKKAVMALQQPPCPELGAAKVQKILEQQHRAAWCVEFHAKPRAGWTKRVLVEVRPGHFSQPLKAWPCQASLAGGAHVSSACM